MWCANRCGNVVADMRIMVSTVRSVEAYHALCYEEGLVVHFVPMGWRTGCVWWECEFGRTYAIVLNDQYLWEERFVGCRSPVLDPSSITLHVIWPSFNISPDVEGTKLIGLRGISIVAKACLASSSMFVGGVTAFLWESILQDRKLSQLILKEYLDSKNSRTEYRSKSGTRSRHNRQTGHDLKYMYYGMSYTNAETRTDPVSDRCKLWLETALMTWKGLRL